VTTTLEDIHPDPTILDRAISLRERLDIVAEGQIAATVWPRVTPTIEEARRLMHERFAASNWQFSVHQPMSRDERNARG
jgi:hypothetical protein